jgi:hypothetical protein
MGPKGKLLMLAAVIVVAIVVLAAYVVLFNDNKDDNEADVQKKFIGEPEDLALVQADLGGTEWILHNDTELSWDNLNINSACRGEFIINPDEDPNTARFAWTIYVFNTSEQANSYYDRGEDFAYWHYEFMGDWTILTGIGDEAMYNDLEQPILPVSAWPYAKLIMFRSSNVVVVLGFVQSLADTGFTMNDTFVDSLVQLQAEKMNASLV